MTLAGKACIVQQTAYHQLTCVSPALPAPLPSAAFNTGIAAAKVALLGGDLAGDSSLLSDPAFFADPAARVEPGAGGFRFWGPIL